jgi:hypothetical protein
MLPFVQDFESQGFFLVRFKLLEIVKAGGICCDECSLLEVGHDVGEVIFSCKVFDVSQESLFRDLGERVRNSEVKISIV